MKRSRSIRLVLLGSAGALALSACDGDPGPQTQVFQDEAQCAKSNDANDCRQALADAREAHRTTAPAFASRETCEAQFGVGNCGPAEAKPTPEQVALNPDSHTGRYIREVLSSGKLLQTVAR